MRLDPEDNIIINIKAKYDEKIEEHKSRRVFVRSAKVIISHKLHSKVVSNVHSYIRARDCQYGWPHVGTLHTRVASQYSILSL